jgi:nucleoside-diphosphate-sugar epimerase
VRIVMTGATGFIGRRLAARLTAEGHSVRALVRRPDARLPEGVELCAGALDDMEFLRGALSDADAVAHLAGEVKSFTARGFFTVNEGLTAALAEGVRRFAPAGAPLLYVSSQAAGGPCGRLPGLREGDQSAPVSHYGLSKLLGERAVQALGAERPVCVARPAMVYGPGDWAFTPLYALMARGVLPAFGAAGQRFSIVYVDDLVDGLLRTLDAARGRGLGGTFHFAGPEVFVWERFAEAFGRELGRRVRVLTVPSWLCVGIALGNTALGLSGLPSSLMTLDKRREAYAGDWLLDCARTRETLDWTPRADLAQGARESVAWCREQGLLPGVKLS